MADSGKFSELEVSSLKDDPYNAPISINNILGMMRHKIMPNERPYTRIVKEINNSQIEAWADEMLKPMANSKMELPAGQVGPLWGMYQQGNELRCYNDVFHKYGSVAILRPKRDQVEFCLKILRADLKEYPKWGRGMIKQAWDAVSLDILLWVTNERVQKIYDCDEPQNWYRNSQKHKDLFKGLVLPPELGLTFEEYKDLEQKVATYLKVLVGFDGV
jgi:hypothetical protein